MSPLPSQQPQLLIPHSSTLNIMPLFLTRKGAQGIREITLGQIMRLCSSILGIWMQHLQNPGPIIDSERTDTETVRNVKQIFTVLLDQYK